VAILITNSSDSGSDSENESHLIAQINITPFVDVVLVLLVIFIVTAPLIAKDILEVRLPKTISGDGQATVTLGLAINRDGQILLNGQIVDEEQLKSVAKATLAENPQAQAIIAGDAEAVYGKVVKVIDLLKQVGLERFAVQVERQSQ
jgi:biopolymer transport protein ExbD